MPTVIDRNYLLHRIRYYQRKNREAQAKRLMPTTDSNTKKCLLEEQFEYQAIIEELKFLRSKLLIKPDLRVYK